MELAIFLLYILYIYQEAEFLYIIIYVCITTKSCNILVLLAPMLMVVKESAFWFLKDITEKAVLGGRIQTEYSHTLLASHKSDRQVCAKTSEETGTL